MSRRGGAGLLDRLLGACFAVLVATLAIHVAARLIESVAATVITVVVVTGGVALVGLVCRVLWSRHRASRW